MRRTLFGLALLPAAALGQDVELPEGYVLRSPPCRDGTSECAPWERAWPETEPTCVTDECYADLFRLWRTMDAVNPEVPPENEVVWLLATADGGVHHLVRKDVRREGNNFSVWVNSDHSGDRSVTYRRSLTRFYLYCNGSYRISALTTYMPDGSVNETWDGYGQIVAIRPGTMAESLERAVCV